jgi:uncharacterized repeat protein (TIGR03803 family)
MKASNGKIYGCTNSGGNNGNGTLFEFDPATSIFTVLYNFYYWDSGYNVSARLAEDGTTGVLYGMTSWGLSNNSGAIFKYDLNTSTYTKIVEFSNNMSGASGFTKANNGKFYGLITGAYNNEGFIIEFDPTLTSYTIKYDFTNGTDGGYPQGSLLQASNGKMYGVTESGGSSNGVVFEYDLNLSSYTVIQNLSWSTGSYGMSELVEPTNGKLIGSTYYGGNYGSGVIFEIDFNTTSYTIMHNFQSGTGVQPRSSLYKASNGKYYATTQYGGPSGSGVLYEYDYATNTYNNKFGFMSKLDGNEVYGSLTKHSNGKMYGLTSSGGDFGNGVIFEFNPTNQNYSVKHSFDYDNDGASPYGSLTLANNGNLYGYTYEGGADDYGTIFEFNPTTSSYTVLHSFDYYEGGNPYYGSLALNNNILYGTTYDGGDQDDGVIYKYDLTTSSYTVIHHFESNFGYEPYSGVTIGANGKLYGTTYYGGNDDYGLIYEFDPTGAGSYTILHEFDETNGSYPYASPIFAKNGKLYGATYNGGINELGVLYEYDMSVSSYTVKYNFENDNGYSVYGELYQAADGNLYGLTEHGSYFGSGVLFKYNLSTSSYSKEMSFNGENGYYGYGSLIETCETPAPQSIATQTICDDATVADLIAFGSNIKWYNSTGSVLAPSTTLVNGDKYYASQTIGCESSAKFEVTYTCTVGMEEEVSTAFGVYPNPNNGEFTIVSENTNTTFTINDITGKLVKTGTISANKTEVNLNEVNTGIYFLKVDNQVSKIVKQ